jgi:hypothetical protein
MTDASGRRQWLLLGSVTAMIMASHRSQPRSAPRVGYGIPTELRTHASRGMSGMRGSGGSIRNSIIGAGP